MLATLVPAYANWLVTVIKSFLHAPGVSLTGERANDGVFVALTALVVIPSFVAGIAWAYGLLARARSKGPALPDRAAPPQGGA